MQEEAAGQSVTGLQLSTTNCVFELTTGTLVKVKPWKEGLQLEGSTIDWINKNFKHVPTTSKIYEWIDYEWSRSFLVMRKAQGSLLRELWPKLSGDRPPSCEIRRRYVHEIVDYAGDRRWLWSPRGTTCRLHTVQSLHPRAEMEAVYPPSFHLD